MAIYAISDLHGRYDLYQEVKKFLKPEDKVFCLGDCGDRGPDGWKLIKAIYDDPQFIYLMGNHEHILLHAMTEYLGDTTTAYDAGALNVCNWNGGNDTLEGWIREGAKHDWIGRLARLPRKVEYANADGWKVILSHAGFSPRIDEEPTPWDLIWDRTHLRFNWPKDEQFKKVILVHGHTPVQYMDKDPLKDDLDYCDGHKIDIDVGAYFTGITCLLDLDSFEEHYFELQNRN